MRSNATLLLAGEETLRLVRSPGPYLLLGLMWAEGSMAIRSFSQYAAQSTVVVVSQPLAVPVALAAISTALYVGLVATTSVAKEREVGSLEVLFTAPIRPGNLVGGYFLAYAGVGAVLLSVSMGLMLLPAGQAGLALGPLFGLQVAAAAVAMAEAVALGLLLSAGARRVRTAVLALLGLLIVLCSLYFGQSLLAARAEPDTWAFYGQELLNGIMRGLQFVSPLASFTRSTGAAAGGQALSAVLWLGSGLLRTLLWLAGARSLLRWVGVRS